MHGVVQIFRRGRACRDFFRHAGFAEVKSDSGFSGSDDPNDSVFVEFAEDVGIAFNSHDIVRWPEGYGRLMDGGTNPFSLPADTWHCVELSFDGQERAQQLYIGGTLQVDATEYPDATQAFTTFKFGYNALHGTVRTTWYDDVAVAAQRIGC